MSVGTEKGLKEYILVNEKKDIKREDMITPRCVWWGRRFNAAVRESSARAEASGRIQSGHNQHTELGHVSRGERGKRRGKR